MAKNISIAGASYTGVPRIDVPITGGGTASFYDCVGSKDITANGTVDVKGLASVLVNVATGGGLPSGIAAVDYGEITVDSAFTTTRKNFYHHLGAVPDFAMVWAEENVAQTYSMLFALTYSGMSWRGSQYDKHLLYHGNSTTTVTYTNSGGANYGVSNLAATTFGLSSHSTSYYWRAGTYKYLLLKFA